MASIGIIDAPSVFHRAYRATRPQFTSADFPTNAIYGLMRVLINIQADANPAYLVAVTGADGIIDTGLNEGDVSRDDALMRQVPHIPRILDALSIPAISIAGHRSADLAATLTRMAVTERLTVTLMACGPDFYQILAEGISVQNPFTGKHAEHGDIIARFGVPPARIPDYLALVGDTSDGRSGVSGIGPKMARQLLEHFGSMDRILDQIDRIEKSGLRERIRENADILRISSRLASFDATVPFSWSPRDFERTDVNWDRVLELLREFELTGLLRRIPLSDNTPPRRIARSEADVEAFGASVQTRLFLRAESEGRPFVRNKPLGIALATARDNSLYIPAPPAGDRGLGLFRAVRTILEDEAVEKVGHDLKWDILALRQLGIRLKGQVFDTCVADRLLAPKRKTHTLGTVALAHIPGGRSPVAEGYSGSGDPSIPSVEKAAAQLIEAVSVIAELSPLLESEVRASGLQSLCQNLDVPLIPVLAELEHEGMGVHEAALDSLLLRTGEDLDRVSRRSAFLAGDRFELSSDKQVRDILFRDLRLSPPRKAAHGYAVDDDVLEDLVAEHDLPQEILDHRYLDRLRLWCVRILRVSRETGSVPMTAGENPLNSVEFNPLDPLSVFVLDSWQPALREIFVPLKRDRIVCGHYRELRLRVLAHLSRDEALMAALEGGENPLLKVAARLFETPTDRVSPEMLRRTRAIESAIERGIGHADLARHLGLPAPEGRILLELYFRKFPSVRTWITESSEQIRKDGWATTIFGRRLPLPLPGPGGSREWVLSLPHRTACLALHGTVSDMVRTSVHRLHEAILRKGVEGRLAGFSLCGDVLVEAPAAGVEQLLELVREEMETALKLSVPVEVVAGAGASWAEARGTAAEVR